MQLERIHVGLNIIDQRVAFAMYVCLCNGHRDRDLRDLAARGVSCAREAYRKLGGEPRCGRCLEFAQDLIDGACPKRAAASPAGFDNFVPAEPAR